jgi:hypothetical protein
LPFLQPGDVGHKIDLTADDMEKMHAASASSISAPTTTIQTRSRDSSSLSPVSSTLPRHQIRGRTYHFLMGGARDNTDFGIFRQDGQNCRYGG